MSGEASSAVGVGGASRDGPGWELNTTNDLNFYEPAGWLRVDVKKKQKKNSIYKITITTFSRFPYKERPLKSFGESQMWSQEKKIIYV